MLAAAAMAVFGCGANDLPDEPLALARMALAHGDLRVQAHHGEDWSATNNEIKPHFRIHNDGFHEVALTELTIRYWYTREGEDSEASDCWWAQVGCENIRRSNFAMATPADGADHYFEVGFRSGAGQLAPGADSGEMKLAFHKGDWTDYDENDDHSYTAGQTSFADAPNVTLHRNGTLVWGTEPGGCGAPTCDDGTQNGDETDVDCGGSCPACPSGASCTQDSNCESGQCENGTCVDAGTGGGLSSAPLQLEVLANSCGANQAQDFFRIVNTGTSPVALSDIKIKFWVNDTSAAEIIPVIDNGGCLTNATGCYEQVSGVTVAAARLSSGCGPDPQHQANWEVTISTTDTASLNPGEVWDNIQSQLHLADYTDFTPGISDWYSPCTTGQGFHSSPYFGLYYRGELVLAPNSGITAPDCRAPHGSQRLPGHITAATTDAPLVGPVPPGTTVRLAIGLPLRNREELENLVQELSNPNSPNYRHYLTPDALTSAYGPTLADYESVETWAAQQNLTATTDDDGQRLVLAVTGTAAAVQRALYVNLNYYQRPDGTQFYALDRDPSLDLTAPVLHVSGLDDFYRPEPASAGRGPGEIEGTDLRAAYVSNASDQNCPDPDAIQGDGQCIGIVAFAPYNPADILAFAERNGFSDFDVDTQVVPVSVDGFDNTFPDLDDLPENKIDWVLEVEGDIEMALAMAPRARVVVYAGVLNTLELILARMAYHQPLCNQLSASLTVVANSSTRQFFEYVFPALGQSFFKATGDRGGVRTDINANPISEDYVQSAYLTTVGGTSLTPDGLGGYSESTWPLGGGGFDERIPIPSYQQDMDMDSVGGSSIARNRPDVSAQADTTVTLVATLREQEPDPDPEPCRPNAPLASGQVIHSGGTSLSAPIWAGFMALANQQSQANDLGAIGFANPALYAIGNSAAYGDCLNDIQTGAINIYRQRTEEADECGEYPWVVSDDAGFAAGAGYDLATGWGSPKCGLIAQLASYAPAPNRDISVGESHTCAIRNDSTISCWGRNDVGQLGDGTMGDPSPSPTPVAAPLEWTDNQLKALQIASGLDHTCAAMSDGSVWCWGDNTYGQLGDDSISGSDTPVRVEGLDPVSLELEAFKYNFLTAGGYHTCVVTGDDRHIQCWGQNDHGQLGNGTISESETVTTVQGTSGPVSDAASLRAGFKHGCVLLVPGNDSMCWGLNDSGQLGDGTTEDSPRPVLVEYPDPEFEAEHLAPGYTHTCVIGSNTDGRVFCWGANQYGQFGNGGTSGGVSPDPTEVGRWRGYSATAIHAGANDTCAVLSWTPNQLQSGLYCAGANEAGQLGIGQESDQEEAPQPVSVDSAEMWLWGVTKVRASLGNHVCALTRWGSVFCWGGNADGQLGDGTRDSRAHAAPVQFF